MKDIIVKSLINSKDIKNSPSKNSLKKMIHYQENTLKIQINIIKNNFQGYIIKIDNSVT